VHECNLAPDQENDSGRVRASVRTPFESRVRTAVLPTVNAGLRPRTADGVGGSELSLGPPCARSCVNSSAPVRRNECAD
jgi:hypothetical protein